MKSILIVNANLVNEGETFPGDVIIKNGKIDKIGRDLSGQKADQIIDAKGAFLLPGLIDDQVHFREPGLTHKANIYSESRAAIAGGVTSYMEMPNTVPNVLTQELLQEKYDIAERTSLANYSFYMGASNDNLDEVLKTKAGNVCGVKIFMGSSTGNMLVDDENTLESIFSNSPMLIATHCEDEQIIRVNSQKFKDQYGEDVPIKFHPVIRSREACYKSSSLAVSLAKKHNARLHVLHISTEDELSLFDNSIPLGTKQITSEACIHHLWFDDRDYAKKGTMIKWNPAIKTVKDKTAIINAVLDGTIDVIATDHAPHTKEEKEQSYFKAPSGGPLLQHGLQVMLEYYHQGKITLEKIVEKMCHNPAIIFKVSNRGFIREGYFADLVMVDPDLPRTVNKESILAKCAWSPFEGFTFRSSVTHTIVSGNLVYENGEFIEGINGSRLLFDRT